MQLTPAMQSTPPPPSPSTGPTPDLTWHDLREWPVEGKGWTDTERTFDRLPRRARGVVRDPVWDRSRHSAGICIRFETDATTIAARWTLLLERLARSDMPATGVSGLDLYGRDDRGRWRWIAVGRPAQFPTAEQLLITGLDPGRRAYTLYLPLYNGVEVLELGIPRGSDVRPLSPRPAAPIVFYGTSILQGASASRPGMCHAAILGRRLARPVINLGFAGNGQMEPEVAALLAELDPCVYVIDCLPNMTAPMVEARAGPLVRTLRAARADTPIVLVEDRTYADAPFHPARRERNHASRAALRAAYERLQASGVTGLHYVAGEPLLGEDGDATVDGSHPNDLGFIRIADILEPVLRPLT